MCFSCQKLFYFHGLPLGVRGVGAVRLSTQSSASVYFVGNIFMFISDSTHVFPVLFLFL